LKCQGDRVGGCVPKSEPTPKTQKETQTQTHLGFIFIICSFRALFINTFIMPFDFWPLFVACQPAAGCKTKPKATRGAHGLYAISVLAHYAGAFVGLVSIAFACPFVYDYVALPCNCSRATWLYGGTWRSFRSVPDIA